MNKKSIQKYACHRVVIDYGNGTCETVYVDAERNGSNTVVSIDACGDTLYWEESVFARENPYIWRYVMEAVHATP